MSEAVEVCKLPVETRKTLNDALDRMLLAPWCFSSGDHSGGGFRARMEVLDCVQRMLDQAKSNVDKIALRKELDRLSAAAEDCGYYTNGSEAHDRAVQNRAQVWTRIDALLAGVQP